MYDSDLEGEGAWKTLHDTSSHRSSLVNRIKSCKLPLSPPLATKKTRTSKHSFSQSPSQLSRTYPTNGPSNKKKRDFIVLGRFAFYATNGGIG